jgi:hypothetical protein
MTIDIRAALCFAIFIPLSVFCFITPATAQTGSLSPYSRYGIGDIYSDGFTHQKAMGGIGAGLAIPNQINPINPASYVADSMVVFELGAFGEMRRLEQSNDATNLNTGSLSHFAVAFPVVKNRASLALSLLPFSSVGYDVSIDDFNVPQIGTVRNIFEGDGGFNKFQLGAGVKLTPKLSAGINAAYLFGTIDQIKSIEFPDGTNYFNTRYVDALTAKGIHLSYGLLYQTRAGSDYRIGFGLTGALSSKVSATRNEYYFNYTISPFGGELLKDSVQNELQRNGKITMPDFLRAGIVVTRNNKWCTGADVVYTRWENFNNFESQDTLKNSLGVHLGGELYSDKLVYRAGFRYGTTYLNLKNTQLSEYGITFGIGIYRLFPKRPPSTINLTIEAGSRGTTGNNLIKEQYLRFHIGFSLTDIWFIKPKYD